MRMHVSSLRHVILLPFALCWLACSSTEKQPPTAEPGMDGGGHGGPHCVTRRDECTAAQRICVVDGHQESCQPCANGEYAKDADTCVPIPGEATHHDFDVYRLDPAEEIDGLCMSWTLGNETELWVNAVELETNGGYHHSNWLFAPDDQYA